MEYPQFEKNSGQDKNIKEEKNHLSSVSIFRRFAGIALTSSILLFSSINARTQDEEQHSMCPRGSSPYFFSINTPSECKGETNKTKTICFECRDRKGRVTNISFERQQEKVKEAINTSSTEIGNNFTKYEIEIGKKAVKKWDKKELENLIIRLNGNLTDDERTIFRGALEHWPTLKYHSLRLNIDPRVTFIVTVAETRFINKIGSSGEKSPMQIMPETAVLMYNLYGKKDPYFIELKKKGVDWRKDTDALMVLALYYLRDGLRSVNALGKRFEEMSAEEILLVYHFYNRGHNNYVTDNWWQGDNLATCTKKYLRLYPMVDDFVKDFIVRSSLADKSIENKTEEKIPKLHKFTSTFTKIVSQNNKSNVVVKSDNKNVEQKTREAKQTKEIKEVKEKKNDVKTEPIMTKKELSNYVKSEVKRIEQEKGNKKEEEKNKKTKKDTKDPNNEIKNERKNENTKQTHEHTKQTQETDAKQQVSQDKIDKLREQLEEIRQQLEKLKQHYCE
jgi:hypothetical protein